MYIDTHCHLHDSKFTALDAVVNEYLKNGVDTAINMGCCARTSLLGKQLAEKYESVYFATGCHPSDSNGFDQKEFDIFPCRWDNPNANTSFFLLEDPM